MIIDPDFLDHWRTGMVAEALGDPMAPIYIMRLWGHCQERRSDVFVMPTRGLKAQCRFPGDAEVFEAALIDAGFIERDGDAIHVVGWASRNAYLMKAWANGSKGGRPKNEAKKEPDENRIGTGSEPDENRIGTGSEPDENRIGTGSEPDENRIGTGSEPIREEKRREEKNPPLAPPSGVARPKREKPRSRCSPDFAPSEAGAGLARSHGLDVQAELRRFIDHHTAVGSTMADWQAAWRTWVSKAVEFGRGRQQNSAGPKRGSDEYLEANRDASWWREAGFGSVWEAANARCWHTNAQQFRDGKRLEVSA